MGGVAAIACNTAEKTVRQGYCYTCLAIGGAGGIAISFLWCSLLGIIERGGTASLRSRTCVKRNAVFGARFEGLSLCSLYQKRESDTYQNRLGYISDTYLRPYLPVTVPPYDYSKSRTPLDVGRAPWL